MSDKDNVPAGYGDPTLGSRTIQPKNINSVVNAIPTMGADFVQILIDFDCEMCTFQFSRNHPIPRKVDGNLIIEGINTEAFLEVKIPLKKAFQAGEFIHGVLVKTQGRQEHGEKYFGPTYYERP